MPVRTLPVLLTLALLVFGAGMAPAAAQSRPEATAIFAGGCFWCMEHPFDKIPGVLDTTSGYIGGHVANPTYEQVVAKRTGHREAVRVTYDPTQVDYETLLKTFWVNVDPLDDGGQFCDRGSSYLTGIYATTPEQLEAAQASKEALQASGQLAGEIVTPVVEAPTFWEAESYHQDFYITNASRYTYYRTRCGRDLRLRQLWGDAAG